MNAAQQLLTGLWTNLLALISWIFTPLKNFTFLQWASVAMSLASAVMAYGDRQESLSWLPGNVAHYWPMVLAAAGVVARYGHIFFPQAVVYTPAQIQAAVIAHLNTPQGQALVAQAVANLPIPSVTTTPPATK